MKRCRSPLVLSSVEKFHLSRIPFGKVKADAWIWANSSLTRDVTCPEPWKRARIESASSARLLESSLHVNSVSAR